MNTMRSILLAEDNPRDAELTIEALSGHGLSNDIVLVEDGVEALDYLHRRGRFAGRQPLEPAVVLLDIKMPRLSGLEVLREIKSDARLKTIPVVILTSSREEPDLRQAYDLGVNAYVVKPVVLADFIEAVREVGVFWALINEAPL